MVINQDLKETNIVHCFKSTTAIAIILSEPNLLSKDRHSKAMQRILLYKETLSPLSREALM